MKILRRKGEGRGAGMEDKGRRERKERAVESKYGKESTVTER